MLEAAHRKHAAEIARVKAEAEAMAKQAEDAAKELAQKNIMVNCITPAAAQTEMFAQMTQKHIDYMLAKIPMGRFVHVDEIAELAAWIASPACSFTTGFVFDISGGRATY